MCVSTVTAIQITHPDHDLLNRKIRRIVRRLMELEDEMLDAGQVPTPQRLVEALRLNLTSENLHGKVLTICQHKTGQPVAIPLGSLWKGKALRIVENYGSLEQLANIGDNRNANSSLREVGKLAKLHRRLHWHLARHTCGTLLNQRGLRMQEIQYILGHQKMQTTERHYAETTFEQVRKSLKKAFKQS